ncbi:hypothetical protein P8452_62139 [Trifolium repens]|nr:hypothetical protein P8452_62139 [Trifolium repens]
MLFSTKNISSRFRSFTTQHKLPLHVKSHRPISYSHPLFLIPQPPFFNSSSIKFSDQSSHFRLQDSNDNERKI